MKIKQNVRVHSLRPLGVSGPAAREHRPCLVSTRGVAARAEREGYAAAAVAAGGGWVWGAAAVSACGKGNRCSESCRRRAGSPALAGLPRMQTARPSSRRADDARGRKGPPKPACPASLDRHAPIAAPPKENACLLLRLYAFSLGGAATKGLVAFVAHAS
jgi:hypothetical protein